MKNQKNPRSTPHYQFSESTRNALLAKVAPPPLPLTPEQERLRDRGPLIPHLIRRFLKGLKQGAASARTVNTATHNLAAGNTFYRNSSVSDDMADSLDRAARVLYDAATCPHRKPFDYGRPADSIDRTAEVLYHAATRPRRLSKRH